MTDRTPNLENGWTIRPGVVQFNFLHRFTAGDAPARKVTSFPTFLFATGLPASLAFGVRYATNSDLFPGIPNEYELWLRRGIVRQTDGAPIDASLTAAYNNAAESADGELALSRALGPVRLLGAVRGMSSGYESDRALWGAGGGAVVRVLPWLSLAGDVFRIVSEEKRGEDFRTAWGAAAQLQIPFTPHTFSIQVVNTNTASLQGSSRGSEPDFTVGFEFTIPITLARYFGGRAAPAARGTPADSAAAAERAGEGVATGAEAFRVMEVRIAKLAFGTPELRVRAGARVRWVNDDVLQHTVSADDGAFDSGLLDPGRSWERTFDRPGTFAYHCTPHPFMRATLVVE